MLHEMGLLIFLAVTSTAQQNLETQIGSNYCDGSLWKRVYKPQRLQKLQPSCITVKLDPKPVFKKLLNDRNRKAQNGNLILRPVCMHKVTRPDAVAACKNFTPKLRVPDQGMHVMVTGTYVQDNARNHGWREIHPVTSILPIP